MNPEHRAMLRTLLAKHIRYLNRMIREEDELSRPCPEGFWRWAGPDAVPGMADRAEAHRAELAIATEALEIIGEG